MRDFPRRFSDSVDVGSGSMLMVCGRDGSVLTESMVCGRDGSVLTEGRMREGSVLTETVFAWPGLGLYLTNALLSADMNAVLGATMVIGMTFLFLNLLTDMLYSKIDPRIS